jgi:preprotein translocase subunit YajC
MTGLMIISNVNASTYAPETSTLNTIPMLLAFAAISYFMLIRPQTQRDKEHKKLMNDLSKGDEIKLTSGILGVVTDVDTIYIKVKIADNTTVKVDKNAIAKILPKNTITPTKSQ